MSLCDGDARPIRQGSLANSTQFGYTGQVTDNRQGIVLDYEIELGMPAAVPRLAPAITRIIAATGVTPEAVTVDRGYGDTDLKKLGVETVAIFRKGKPGKTRQAVEAEADFVELIKWRTGELAPAPEQPRKPGQRSWAGSAVTLIASGGDSAAGTTRPRKRSPNASPRSQADAA